MSPAASETADSSAGHRSITESPWYWAYLFAAVGLGLLLLFSGRLMRRQAQIEQKYQRRQRVVRLPNGPEASGRQPLSTADRTQISLTPVYVALGFVLSAAGIALWLRRRSAGQALNEKASE